MKPTILWALTLTNRSLRLVMEKYLTWATMNDTAIVARVESEE